MAYANEPMGSHASPLAEAMRTGAGSMILREWSRKENDE